MSFIVISFGFGSWMAKFTFLALILSTFLLYNHYYMLYYLILLETRVRCVKYDVENFAPAYWYHKTWRVGVYIQYPCIYQVVLVIYNVTTYVTCLLRIMFQYSKTILWNYLVCSENWRDCRNGHLFLWQYPDRLKMWKPDYQD